MAVLVASLDMDPWIRVLDLCQILKCLGLGGAIVRDAELPVRVDLREDGVDGIGQVLPRGVVGGKEDGDRRRIGQMRQPLEELAEAIGIDRVVGGYPRRVLRKLRFRLQRQPLQSPGL